MSSETDKPKSKYGRKKLSAQEKKKNLTIRLNPKLRSSLEERCYQNGHENLTDFCTHIFENALNDKKYISKSDTKTILQINKIGNNINQIVKKINTFNDLKSIEVTNYLSNIKDEIDLIYSLLKNK